VDIAAFMDTWKSVVAICSILHKLIYNYALMDIHNVNKDIFISTDIHVQLSIIPMEIHVYVQWAKTGMAPVFIRIYTEAARVEVSIHCPWLMSEKSIHLKILEWTSMVHGYSIDTWISICVFSING